MLAPEAVTIAVASASMAITNVDAYAGSHTLEITADVDIAGVAWSVTGVRPGYRIRVAYSVWRYAYGAPVGYDPPDVIATGMIVPAYLEWNGFAYQPAARAASFSDLTTAQTMYPGGIEGCVRETGWRYEHPGYGQSYPGPRPGSQPSGGTRGFRRLTQIMGA